MYSERRSSNIVRKTNDTIVFGGVLWVSVSVSVDLWYKRYVRTVLISEILRVKLFFFDFRAGLFVVFRSGEFSKTDATKRFHNIIILVLNHDHITQ